MDNKSVFVRTVKGEDEVRSKTAQLYGDAKHVLPMVDGIATFGEISERAAPSLHKSLYAIFKELQSDGFIQDKARAGNIPEPVELPRIATQPDKPATGELAELDFTTAFHASTPEKMAGEASLETTKSKAVADAEARAEAEAKARQEIEAAKVREKTEQRVQEDADAMLLQSARDAAQTKAMGEAIRPRPHDETMARSTSATVLFIDVVGYTRQSVNRQTEIKKQFTRLLSDCLEAQGDGGHIILDTGDGAAVGFLQHPEDALQVAMQFRNMITANQHKDYPDLNVRIGIHLGPINIVEGMSGQRNMVGDGINDAQRMMSFADAGQIYISRPYYDFVSRLSDEYANLFQYRGLKEDKHGREHPVYELVSGNELTAEALLQSAKPAAPIKLEPFNFTMPGEVPVTEFRRHEEVEPGDAELLEEIKQLNQPKQVNQPVGAEQPQTARPPELSRPEIAAKPVARAHMPSAEEVNKVAEAQAKARADAERRAAENAKAAVRAKQPHSGTPLPAKSVPPVRARRKPASWGKTATALFVLMLIAVFAVPFVLPTAWYATRVEQHLAAGLKQPVHIGQLTGRLLPTPRLELGDVSIGEAGQIRVRQARVEFAFLALFSSTKPVKLVELDGVQVNGAALPQVSAWLQQVAADTEYPVAHITLKQGKLEADSIQLSGVGGDLMFNQAGKFSQARLHAEENRYEMELNSTPENKLQASIKVHGSALPLLPDWVFDELSAEGELTADGLSISELDGRIWGGMVLGNARIDWRSGWRAQGTLIAKTITLQNMNKVLSGDMDATAHFMMHSPGLDKLAASATLDGTFGINQGNINGIDIVETANLRSRINLPGGRTHFEELSGDLSTANGEYHFRKLKMDAGVLKATGAVDIVKRDVSGLIYADLAIRAGMGTVAMQLGGTTEALTLRALH